MKYRIISYKYINLQASTMFPISLAHYSQFNSVKVKKIVRRSQAQFREKLRKLRLRKNDGFLIKNVYVSL